MGISHGIRILSTKLKIKKNHWNVYSLDGMESELVQDGINKIPRGFISSLLGNHEDMADGNVRATIGHAVLAHTNLSLETKWLPAPKRVLHYIQVDLFNQPEKIGEGHQE